MANNFPGLLISYRFTNNGYVLCKKFTKNAFNTVYELSYCTNTVIRIVSGLENISEKIFTAIISMHFFTFKSLHFRILHAIMILVIIGTYIVSAILLHNENYDYSLHVNKLLITIKIIAVNFCNFLFYFYITSPNRSIFLLCSAPVVII